MFNIRMNETRKLTDVDSWMFCPGKKNPTDLPSRRIRGADLAQTEAWLNGAEFLKFQRKSGRLSQETPRSRGTRSM